MTGVLLWISLNIDLTQSKIWALCFSFFVPLLSQRLLITWSWWTVTLRATSQIKQRLVGRFDVDRRKSWTKQPEVNVRARNATSLSAGKHWICSKNLQETLEDTSPICVHLWKRSSHLLPHFSPRSRFPALFLWSFISRAFSRMSHFPALFSCCGFFSRPFYFFPYFTRYMMFQLTKLFPVLVPCRCLGHCYGA